MSISNMSGWSAATNPATVIQGVNHNTPADPSPAIQALTLAGTFVSNNNNHVAWTIAINEGYRVTNILISAVPNTVDINLVADSYGHALTYTDQAMTSVDYQSNNFSLYFQVNVSGQSTKTYTFTKGKVGGGRPPHR